MRCLVLQHLDFENLGLFESELIQKNFVIDYKKVGVDVLIKEEFILSDLVILLGSPISINQNTDFPWINDILRFVEIRLALKKPTLGICLGAQIIAKVMGAHVYKNRKIEIGWDKLILTNQGLSSCLNKLQNEYVLHWHGETFDLPASCDLLASSSLTTNQAFALENYVLALQFHCEVHFSKIEPWLIGHSFELKTHKISITDFRQKSKNLLKTMPSMSGGLMLQFWLNNIFK